MQSYSNRTLWILFAFSATAAIAWFFIPAFIIRPFTHQTPSGLAWAMALRQHAPWVTLIAALVSLTLALLLWNAVNRWLKAALVSVMVLVTFSTVMARLNYFEWMFHPVENLQFESEAGSKLGASEMILAVAIGTDARAYPIREMAYHHLVNDEVEGIPILPTY
jgi:hypothetical protein